MKAPFVVALDGGGRGGYWPCISREGERCRRKEWDEVFERMHLADFILLDVEDGKIFMLSNEAGCC